MSFRIEHLGEIKVKKFGITGQKYRVHIEGGVWSDEIFTTILNHVYKGADDSDLVGFSFSSEQLRSPLVIPFLPVAQLSVERLLRVVEQLIQSNEPLSMNLLTVEVIRVKKF